MTTNELYNVLGRKVGFVKLEESLTENQLRVMGRVPSEYMSTWLVVLGNLLEPGTQWNTDISKQYFKRGGKVWYSWRLIFQAQNIVQYLPSIAQLVDVVQIAHNVEQTEAPLVGHSRRNTLVRGKGAQSAERPVVGPMALVKGS